MLRWWEINWKMERGDEGNAKERAGHCLRPFSRVLRGGYYGEVCILILASEAATSGCGGGAWFMRHLVIIQWGGGGGGGVVNDNKNKHVLQHPLSPEYVWVSIVQSPSAWGSFPLDVEVSYVFHGKWHGCQVLERSNPLVVRKTRRRPRSCLFSNVTYSHSWALSRWQMWRTEMTLRRIFNCEGQPARRNTCIITDYRIFPSLPQLITAAGLRILTRFFHGYTRVPESD